MDEQRVTANGVDFAYLSDGPGDGPLALCLHGFPDTAHTWRHLLPRLADAGYHAVAPFLRGYAPTSVPADGRYDTGTLALDACALHQALGGDGDAVIIGHDWGAFATYGAAAYQPERWRRVVTAAVPPRRRWPTGSSPSTSCAGAGTSSSSRRPWPSTRVSLDDYAFIDRLWADWSPGFDGTWDVARVKEALGSPESLGAAIGYYRAMFAGPPDNPRRRPPRRRAGTVAPQPTLYLHGADDGCMGIDTIGPVTEFLAPGSEMVMIEGAGHFLHVEKPDEVNDHIIRFITA